MFFPLPCTICALIFVIVDVICILLFGNKLDLNFELDLKNGIMNGNQSDRVTFVLTGCRGKHRLSFYRIFRQLIQHQDDDVFTDLHSETPTSHLLNGWVGMGCQALNFRLRANYLLEMLRMHACLQNVQHIYIIFQTQETHSSLCAASSCLAWSFLLVLHVWYYSETLFYAN